MSNYLINPVRAACMKSSNSNANGIQGYNNTCFGVCAAFSGTYDTYAMDPQCTKACEEFIEKKRHEIYGVGSCDHQVPYRPVFWGQVPHYVPILLKKGETPDNALNVCKKLCGTNQECKDECYIDYTAIEQFQQKDKKNQEVIQPEKKKENNYNKLFIIIILLSIVLTILLMKR